jgi:hypothetical protein
LLRGFAQRHPGGALARQAEAEIAKLESASRGAAEGGAILQTLARYAGAYAREQTAEIQAVWPSIPARTLNTLKSTFRECGDIALELTPAGEPTITGDRASVACQRSLRQVCGKTPFSHRDSITVRLRRAGGGWIIESIE